MQSPSASPSQSQTIHSLMKENKSYWHIKKEILHHLYKHHKAETPLTADDILKSIATINLKEQLKHLALTCVEKTIKRVPLQVDPKTEVEAVRLKWCDNILTSYRTVTSKLKKDDQEQEEDESVNYVYDCLSFLDYLTRIKSVTGVRHKQLTIYMFPEEVISVPKFSEMKVRFDFLNSPDNLGSRDKDALYREKEKKAKKLIEGDAFPTDIEAFLLHGCSNGERMQVYEKYFHLEPQQRSVLNLLEDAQKNPNPIDKIFVADMSDIQNDTKYFIFRAEIKLVLKMFLRDRTIRERIKIRPYTFSHSEEESVRDLPINQIIPCQQFAKLIAPFCYCSMKVDSIYYIFREFYCQYFCLLQSVSSAKNSALYLCMLFEELLDSSERKIALHFSQLGIKPLQLVFPWMFYCFVGYIDIQQIFYLFDRMIGMKSLDILALYAVSLIFKEKANILQAKSFDSIQEVLHRSMEEDIMQETVKYYLAYHL